VGPSKHNCRKIVFLLNWRWLHVSAVIGHLQVKLIYKQTKKRKYFHFNKNSIKIRSYDSCVSTDPPTHKLLDDLKERRGYSHLKEESLDRTIWRAGFGRGYGPVVRQTTEWMNEWIQYNFSSWYGTTKWLTKFTQNCIKALGLVIP